MKQLLGILALFLVFSCATRQEKAHRYFQENKGELAVLCDREFPNDTVRIIIGETIVKTDTLFAETGTRIPCPETPDGGKQTWVECPPAKTVTITKERIDTLVLTDTRKTKALEFQLASVSGELRDAEAENKVLQSKYAAAKKEKNKLLWILIALAAAGLGFGFYKLFRP